MKIKIYYYNQVEICTTETYVKSNGSCACGTYLELGLTWRQAADQCYALGGRLPEIHSEGENVDIINFVVCVNTFHNSLHKHKLSISFV